MPQMGESIAEGTVSKWLKKVGDEVKRDEAILEISTDKVDAEIPSPSAGVLAEILVDEGKTVPVQTVIARVETDKSAGVPAAAPGPAPAQASAASAASSRPASPAPPPPPPPPPAPPSHAAQVATPAPAAVAPARPVASAPPVAVPSTPPATVHVGPETAEERLRRRSTPLVRKMAADHNVDLSRLSGSGYAGRVTKKDIVEYIEQAPAAGAPASVPAPAAPPVPARTAPTPPVAAPQGVTHPTVEPWPGDRVEPMSKIRRLTADHMVMSRRTSAHVTSFFEVDFTRVAQLRAQHKADYQARGVKLTFLGFIAKTVADLLPQHPVVNASVSGDQIIYRKQVNLGIAVALDWGLIVPVIRHADELSLFGISKTMADLADRARTKRLSPDEVQNGTFTITNPGVFGSYTGAPIINQPQVAILGVGAIEKRPKVVTLPDGEDVIAVRTVGMISMSYDHRIVDGADGDRFLAAVKERLEGFPEGAL